MSFLSLFLPRTTTELAYTAEPTEHAAAAHARTADPVGRTGGLPQPPNFEPTARTADLDSIEPTAPADQSTSTAPPAACYAELAQGQQSNGPADQRADHQDQAADCQSAEPDRRTAGDLHEATAAATTAAAASEHPRTALGLLQAIRARSHERTAEQLQRSHDEQGSSSGQYHSIFTHLSIHV